MSLTTHKVWRLGAEIDTDQLAPGAYMKLGIEGIAPHCLEAVRPEFSGRGGGAGGGADASAFQAFTSCLKDHGVTLPTGSPSARPGRFGNLNTSDPKVAKAYATCKPLLPQRPAPSAT